MTLTNPSTLTKIPTVRNLREAARIAHTYDAVLTVGPRADEVAHFDHPRHLVVTFDDVTDPRWADAPRVEQIRRVLEWAVPIDGTLLVHCHAGISRSTACAYGIAVARGVDPVRAASELAAAHPDEPFGGRRSFFPNELILRHLEQLLGREDLLAAVDPHRRWEI